MRKIIIHTPSVPRFIWKSVHGAPQRNYSANCTRRIITLQSRKYEFRTSVNAKSHVGLESFCLFLTTLAQLNDGSPRKCWTVDPIALGGIPIRSIIEVVELATLETTQAFWSPAAAFSTESHGCTA